MKPISPPKPNKDQYGNVVTDESKEPASPLSTFMPIVRWILYSMTFWGILGPFYLNRLTVGEWISSALILGWFAGMLNAIINKK